MNKLYRDREIAPLVEKPLVDDPYESSEYAAFVEAMAEKCECDPEWRPCAGCLAGGVCDQIHCEDEDRERW